MERRIQETIDQSRPPKQSKLKRGSLEQPSEEQDDTLDQVSLPKRMRERESLGLNLNRMRHPFSDPWGEKEVRFVPANSQTTLSKIVWKELEQQILQEHYRYLMKAGLQGQTVGSLSIQRIFYNLDMLCGSIELTPEGNPEEFKSKVVPSLRLSMRLQAMTANDPKVPVVSTFSPYVFQSFKPAQWQAMITLFHPTLRQETFIHKTTEEKAAGRVFHFKTSMKGLEYIQNQSYMLKSGLGPIIFNRRVEYEPATITTTSAVPRDPEQDDLLSETASDNDPMTTQQYEELLDQPLQTGEEEEFTEEQIDSFLDDVEEI